MGQKKVARTTMWMVKERQRIIKQDIKDLTGSAVFSIDKCTFDEVDLMNEEDNNAIT